MLELVKAALLGVVEGVTEFLPISSTGHLIVASRALGVTDSGGTFEIVIQLGAVLAVVWFYRDDLIQRLTSLRANSRFWTALVVGVLPAGVAGFFFIDDVKTLLFTPTTVGIALIAGGVVIWFVEQRPEPGNGDGVKIVATGIIDVDAAGPRGLDAIDVPTALRIGLIQLSAMIPGVSRSGATIIGGMLVGLDRQTATAYSFYLAIPVLGGATIFDLLQNLSEISSTGRTEEFVVGIVFSFVTAFVAVGWLLKYVGRHDFRGFAVYRIIAGLVILGLVAVGAL